MIKARFSPRSLLFNGKYILVLIKATSENTRPTLISVLLWTKTRAGTSQKDTQDPPHVHPGIEFELSEVLIPLGEEQPLADLNFCFQTGFMSLSGWWLVLGNCRYLQRIYFFFFHKEEYQGRNKEGTKISNCFIKFQLWKVILKHK